jgi:TonB family protein
MRQALLLFAAASLLAACAPSPLMSEAPVEVGAGELHKFWVPAKQESQVSVPKKAQEEKVPGSVVVEYTIDSNGHVISPSIVSAEPSGVYEKAALGLVRRQRFEPAPSNDQRLPVHTRTEITFNQ